MDISLRCACGAVEGVAIDVTPQNGNRVVCCCDDCQAFVAHLQAEDVLDEFGGTDIYQTSQSQIRFEQGAEHLRCLRLKPKGTLRWYTDCCNSPIGNTMSANNPFVGVIHNMMSHQTDRSTDIGPVLAYVQTRHARGTPTYPHSAEKFPPGITARIIIKMLLWKIKGMQKPTPFFDTQGKPVVKPIVLG